MPCIRFYVKLNIDASKEIIDSVPGVIESVLLFPDETEADLKTIYVVDVEPPFASDILTALMSHPDIEYVEMPGKKTI